MQKEVPKLKPGFAPKKLSLQEVENHYGTKFTVLHLLANIIIMQNQTL
jgi:hypothetical protein